MNELAKDFNTSVIGFVNFLISLKKDDVDLIVYKNLAQSIIYQEPKKLIEQFIIHVLPFYKEIISKDVNFFIQKDYGLLKKNDKNLLDSLKVKKIFPTLPKDIQNLICEYLILLSNYAKEFFKLKLSSETD